MLKSTAYLSARLNNCTFEFLLADEGTTHKLFNLLSAKQQQQGYVVNSSSNL